MVIHKETVLVMGIMLGIGLVSSCANSGFDPKTGPEVTNKEGVPQLPPISSVALDLSVFYSDRIDSLAAEPHNHYMKAASLIKKIQTIKTRNIDVLKRLFESSDTSDAVEIKKGKWQWTYDNKTGRLNYETRLVAILQDDQRLRWEVYIASPILQDQELLLIGGVSNDEVTQGEWTYYSIGNAVNKNKELATLSWQTDSENALHVEVALKAGNLFEGSQMVYDTDGSVRTIILSPEDKQTTTISFNVDTRAGYIVAPNYNKGEKACWDGSFKDSVCTTVSL